MSYVHQLLDKAKIRININDVLATMIKHQVEFSNRKTAPELLGLMRIKPNDITRAAFTNLISRYKRGQIKGNKKFANYTIINLRDGKGYFVLDLTDARAVEFVFKESYVAFKDTITREHNSTKKLERATNTFISYGKTLEDRATRTGLVESNKDDLSQKLLDHQTGFNKHTKKCKKCSTQASSAQKVCTNCGYNFY